MTSLKKIGFMDWEATLKVLSGAKSGTNKHTIVGEKGEPDSTDSKLYFLSIPEEQDIFSLWRYELCF